jgi:hypothetical protein
MDNLATSGRSGYARDHSSDDGAPEVPMHHNTRRQPTDSDAIQETVSRARRIETRLTGLLVALGHDTEAQKPRWSPSDSSLILPSPHTSLKECLAAIPNDWTGEVKLSIGSELVGRFKRAGT